MMKRSPKVQGGKHLLISISLALAVYCQFHKTDGVVPVDANTGLRAGLSKSNRFFYFARTLKVPGLPETRQ
jgi:hypothetical protein